LPAWEQSFSAKTTLAVPKAREKLKFTPKMPGLDWWHYLFRSTHGSRTSRYEKSTFAAKWTRGANGQAEPLLGSADIQSLADLANSFAVFKEVKPVPFGKETIVAFLVVIAIPLAPLALTMFSPEELLSRLIKIVM
jgi:hypothetical protein